ncbi:MAG: hypothetical protein V1834_04690 [Candidatus Micrarchaeota archaeon]
MKKITGVKDLTVPKSATQSAPAFDGKTAPYMWVPLGAKGTIHGDRQEPIHSLEVRQRCDLLTEWFSNGEVASYYHNWLYAILAAVGVLLTFTWNLYVAAVFAYLAGHCWSKYMVDYAWSNEWYKTKALISTK